MENNGGLITGASPAQWFFVEARVAQAVAIVKNKPSGLSGREYAEVLTRKLRSRDEDWRRRGQELQQEVLRLRQDLLIARVAAEQDDSVVDASRDLSGPEGGGCGSETPPPLLQTPFPPPQPPGSSTLPHVQFLRCLCSLHQPRGGSRGLEALWFQPGGGAGAVLADTVCQLLESVVGVCRDPPPLGRPDPVLQACRVAAGVMEMFCCHRLPSVEFRRRVEESLRELTGMLLHCSQPSRLQAAERLTAALVTLGGSSMSRPFLLRHLLSHLSAVADQLWQAFQDPERSGLDSFPVDRFQTSSYLFGIVEELLHRSKVPCRVEVGSEQTGFLAHLEQRVFLLSEEFPLFSMYMWRIGRLLTAPPRTDEVRP